MRGDAAQSGCHFIIFVKRGIFLSAVYLPQQKTNLNVEMLTGKKIALDVKSSDTIKIIKDKIEATEGIPSHEQILYFDGKRMENSHRLSFYKIQPKSTVQLIKRGMIFFFFCGWRWVDVADLGSIVANANVF